VLYRCNRILCTTLTAVLAILSLSSKSYGAAAQYYWKIKPSSLVITPLDRSQIGVEKDFLPGDEVMRAYFGVAGAELLGPGQANIGGESWAASAGKYLAAVNATGGPIGSRVSEERTFCSEGAPTSGGTKDGRHEIKFCFTDLDNDGRLDHGFLAGSTNAEAAALSPIDHIPYRYRRDVRLPNSYISLKYVQPPKYNVNGRQIVAQVTIFGRFEYAQTIFTRTNGRRASWNVVRGVGGISYPRVLEFGEARVTVLSFDKVTGKARLRVDQDFGDSTYEGGKFTVWL